MPFSEELKLSVRRRSHFCCCLCRSLGVEVHHIIPEAEGGSNTDENAAPLCPACHETYGANPQKRKFIREARDLWYEICEKRYASDGDRLAELSEQLKNAVTKEDLEKAVKEIEKQLTNIVNASERSIPQKRTELSQAAGFIGPGVGANRHCKKCNSQFGLIIGDTGVCPVCGTPW
jgi:hypothetical protein